MRTNHRKLEAWKRIAKARGWKVKLTTRTKTNERWHAYNPETGYLKGFFNTGLKHGELHVR